MSFGHGIGLGVVGAGGFYPTDIGGCILWLPDNLSAVTFEGPADACARWLDRSANRYDVAQTTAAKRPTVSGAMLSFDLASVQALQRPMLSEIDAGAYTIGTAQRFRQVVSQQCVYANALSGGAAGIYVTSNPNRYVTHTNVSGVSWGANTTNPETWIARHNGAGGQADFCLNGAHLTPQALGQSLTGTGTFDIAAYVGAVFPSDIDLYAIVVYSDRKSDAVVDQLSAYLTALRNGVAPPVGWVPSDETNLVLWLERPDLYAAHPINTWWDQSGSGRDVTQGVSANQPAWSASGGPLGQPCIGFDLAGPEYLSGTWAQAQPIHTFAIVNPSRSGAFNEFVSDGDSLNNLRLIISPNATTLQFDAAGGAGGSLSVAGVAAGAWHRVETIANGGSSSLIVDALAPSTGAIGAVASDGLTLAVGGNKATWPADASYAEIVQYSAPVTGADLTALRAYFAAKYGL